MSLYIPFIFFTALFYSHYKKVGSRLDLPGFILLIFGISAFFSVIMYSVGLTIEASETYRPSWGATLFYCGAIYVCILPFLIFSNLSFTAVEPTKHEQLLRILGWVAFGWFLLTLFVDINAIIQVLSGDLAALRSAVYDSDDFIQSEAANLPFVIRAPWTLLNYIFKCSWVMVFLALYSRSVQKLPWMYFLFFLLASTNVIMESIMSIDRSKVVYWLISIGACLIFFRNYLTQKERKVTTSSLIIISSIAIIYLAMMTETRFGDRTYGNAVVEGSLGGIISYLGQPFPNFCNFFDNFVCNRTTLASIFPTYYYFFKPDEPSGLVIIQQYIDAVSNYRTGVFCTFVGTILTMLGKTAAVIFCCSYSLISTLVLYKIHRKKTTIVTIYVYYALSSILLLGLFGYYYANPLFDLSVLVSFFIIMLFKSSSKHHINVKS